VVRASTTFVLFAVVFVFALYAFVAHGEAVGTWIEASIPLDANATSRILSAFRNTGRGLIVGAGGTALVQGVVAATIFALLGVPRPACSEPSPPSARSCPSWGPRSSGRRSRCSSPSATTSRARRRSRRSARAGSGMIDNVVRPVLLRYGHLELPTLAVLAAMLGGIAILGPTGALLGPLVVRLAVESLAIATERGILRERPAVDRT
jgi:predicted PurR-regulated permease PerM